MASPISATKPAVLLTFAPFFQAQVIFKPQDRIDAGAFNCVACGDDIGPACTDKKKTIEAVTYSRDYLGLWAHIACLKKARITVTDDKKEKKAAQLLQKPAFDAANAARRKTTTTTTVSSTPARTTVTTYAAPPAPTPALAPTTVGSLDALTADLRATIEAEYESLMQQALAAIQAKNARIATLESDNEKLAMELSKIMVASVATPDPEMTPAMNGTTLTAAERRQNRAAERAMLDRCGAPKKDGTACRWDTSKTACMHHNRAA